MNPVLILTRNNLALTKRCVASVQAQDILVHPILIIDNGSTDGSQNYRPSHTINFDKNYGVSYGWNTGLDRLFSIYLMGDYAYHHVLVVGNDTVLPPAFYRTLLSANLPFVTGIAVDNMEQANQTPHVEDLEPRPDFSAFLIRRDCWETIGRFDERMKHYCSDQDYHIRAHRLGVQLHKAAIPFYHERSSTIRLAMPEERQEIEHQANLDRAFLREKWGVSAGGPDYEALFSPETFGCDQTRTSHAAPSPAECDTASKTDKVLASHKC